nr:FecR family protein [Paenibacillus turpanensis]
MTLNEGDRIETSSGSSLVLKISDSGHEITVGEDADVYVSELNESGGKKNGFKVWVGSMWNKVTSLGGSDEYEVETSTSVMGVRGTNLLVYSNPNGLDKLFVASGIVSASTITQAPTEKAKTSQPAINPQSKSEVRSGPVLVYPTLNAEFFIESKKPGIEVTENITVVDSAEFIKLATPKMIESIISSKNAVDQENAEMIEKFRNQIAEGGQIEGTLTIRSQEELQRYEQNTSNLISNLVKQAIDEKKIKEQTVNEMNKDLNHKIDLKTVPELDPTAGIDPTSQEKLEETKRALDELLAEQKKQKEAAYNEAMKSYTSGQLSRIVEEKKKQENANTKALGEVKEKAIENYKNSLDAMEKAKFQQQSESAQQKLSNQQQKSGETQIPARPSTGTSNDSGSGSDGGSGGTLPAIALTTLHSSITPLDEVISGKATSGADVKLFVGSSTTPAASATAAADGTFSLSLANKPAIGGTYKVTASKSGYTSQSVTLTVKPAVSVQSAGDQLKVKLNGFSGTKAIKAVQLHFSHSTSLGTYDGYVPSGPLNAAENADMLKTVAGTNTAETIFAGVANTSGGLEVTGDAELVSIRFVSTQPNQSSGDVKLVKAAFYDVNGVLFYELPVGNADLPAAVTITAAPPAVTQ